ncbi:MAG: beta-galactosidase [Streptosporangiales bacterium]|nr:beta-galactosidase [Streptosporangiales bacterium]
MTSFQVGPDAFLLDGRPFRVISGAMHYFRTLPEQHGRRLELLRGMGLNTIETYVAWNVHEPLPGRYVWNGLADLEGFLDAVADLGMYAIVRPGPYICAEWDNGGLPAWLLRDRSARVRCYDTNYLAAVDRWFDQLVPRLAARQIHRGGNVIMVQVENEYGHYGTDRPYLEHLAGGLRGRGIEVPLFTSDGPTDAGLAGGSLPGVLATVNFGSGAKDAFTTLRRHQPDAPLMCMEYWNGWFDHWGERHHVRTADDTAQNLGEILDHGASVNIYMAHGGTSFGFWAGSNRTESGELEPTVTSYDYDAPLDEAGRPTDKYWAYRKVIGKHVELPPEPVVRGHAVIPATDLPVDGHLDLRAGIDRIARAARSAPVPLTFEELGISGGLMRYRCTVTGPRPLAPLRFEGLGDIAHVWVDDEFRGVMSGTESLDLAVPDDGARLEVIVSAYGRTNFGIGIGDRKGIVGGVVHGTSYLHGWESTPVPLDALPMLDFTAPPSPGGTRDPAFWRAALVVDTAADGYLAMPGWDYGVVWVNGFCLGRYDGASGPQQTLYLPWPLLRPGKNEVAVLELGEPSGRKAPVVALRDAPDLGPPER